MDLRKGDKYIIEIMDVGPTYVTINGGILTSSAIFDHFAPYDAGTQKDRDRAYAAGAEDAWKIATKVVGMSHEDRLKIFDTAVASEVFKRYTAREVAERAIVELEHISVGDEVYVPGHPEVSPMVVTKIERVGDGPYFWGFSTKDGKPCQGGLEYLKTGRRVSGIEKIICWEGDQK